MLTPVESPGSRGAWLSSKLISGPQFWMAGSKVYGKDRRRIGSQFRVICTDLSGAQCVVQSRVYVRL